MSPQLINVTEGPILRQVMRLAWPAVSAMALRTALLITNAIWVGRLGAPEMAAVISSMFVIWLLFSMIDIVSTGTVAVIARFYGAREIDKVSHTARQAVMLAIAGAIVMTVFGVFGADTMFRIMDTSPKVAQLGKGYLQTYFAFSFVLLLNELFGSVFRATGDTKTPLTISLTSTVLNIILDPLLIFGIGPFPKLGVTGAAAGAAISIVVGFTMYLIMIKRGRLTFTFDWKGNYRPDFRMINQIVRIGLPLAAAGTVFSIVYLFMNRITASFGTEAIAALGIGNRCESLSYLVCFGFSIAVATLVGQNLGAKKPERAATSTWYTVWITCGITMVISLGFLLFPTLIASAFISDPKVKTIAADYLIILALSQSFMAIEIVLEGAFSGAGDTLPPMIVSVLGSFARVPLAYFICFNMNVGVDGVWWSITLTSIVKGIILVFWFRRNKWKFKQVHA
jgi:putative MATE family efflux protein